ncbi:hypothetical protein C8R47DRAFT_93636 [Mycena vitilis]|nr:hypothetical protein C8R47DRAFT_93636 [Mycena vitilis]
MQECPETRQPKVQTTLQYHFRDTGHRPARFIDPLEISVESPTTTTVIDLWYKIQSQHQDRYVSGECKRCTGPILITGMWLVDWGSEPSTAVLTDLGLLHQHPVYPLNHNEELGIIWLEPALLLSSYALEGKRIVIEATFKPGPTRNVPAARSAKRAMDDPNTNDLAIPTSKRHKFDGNPIFLSYCTSDDMPATLPKPFTGFSVWLNVPRTAIVDKTDFIPPLNALLDTKRCAIWAPSGTGKSGLLSVLYAYWDALGSPEMQKTFSELLIGEKLRQTPSETYGRAGYLCLKLNFRLPGLRNTITEGSLQGAFDTHLVNALRSFVKKYHKQLGFKDPEAAAEYASKPLRLRTVLQLAGQNKQRVFIGIDNFDEALSTALTIVHSETHKLPFVEAVTNVLRKVLNDIVNTGAWWGMV